MAATGSWRHAVPLDGLTGARSAGDEYGAERVTRLVRQQAARPPAELISACLDELRAFGDGANA